MFDPLTTETSSLSKYVIGESGIALTIVFIALAVVFWSLRRHLPQGVTAMSKTSIF